VIVDCAAYAEGCRQTGTLDLEEAGEWAGRAGHFVWLGLRMPTQDEIDRVEELLGIDHDALDEALTPHLRPVLSIRPELTWVVLRTVRHDARRGELALGEMSVMAGADFVVTIRYGQASPLTGLRERLEREDDVHSPAAVLAAIVDLVIEDHRVALDGFEKDAIEAEREVFADTRSRPVEHLLDLKRQSRDLFLAIEPLHEPLRRMARRIGPTAGPDVLADLEESGDKLAGMIQRVHTLSDLLDAAIDANLTQVSLQQNEDMRRISAWVAIAAVPTMVAGIYGMNFETFPELGWRFGYPLVLAGMATAAGLLYRAFRRSGWL
jgi:magnesium transporter